MVTPPRDAASVVTYREFVPCGLKVGHEGPHEPVKLGEQTASEAPAASLDPRCRCQRHHVCASCLGLLRENVRGGGRVATALQNVYRLVKVSIARRYQFGLRDRIPGL